MSERMDEAVAASRLMDMTIAHWAGELLLQAAEMGLADKFTGDAPRSAKDSVKSYRPAILPVTAEPKSE